MTVTPQRGQVVPGNRATPVVSNLHAAARLSAALVAVAAVAAALTLFVPGILHGPAAMNGSARGTALVVLLVALPLIAGCVWWARARGSVRALVGWLGGLGYLLYNAVLFLFATPFNRLFLLYVAMLSLAIWAVLVLIRAVDLAALRQRFTPGLPVRAIAGYLWVIAAVNAVAWLARILPALGHPRDPVFLYGTGLPTSPTFVQDLAFWIPLTVAAAAWLWRHDSWGHLLAGALLVMGVVESTGVAVDQWFGYVADPHSPAVSAAVVPVFAALAVVGLAPLIAFLRHVTDQAGVGD